MARTPLGTLLFVALVGALLPAVAFAQQAAPFPTDGLAAWLRADDAVADAGAAVTSWPDRSDNGRDATARGSSPPMLNGSGLAGCPAVSFTGGGDVAVDLDISPAVRSDVTVFTVFSTDIASGDFAKLYGHDDGGFDRAVGIDTRASTGFGVFTGADVGDYYDPPVNTPLLHVDSWTASSFTSESIPTGASTTLSVSNGSGLAELALGSSGRTFGEYWEGAVAEFLVYERALTPTEIDEVTAYLTDRYGLEGGAPTCAATSSDPTEQPTPEDADADDPTAVDEPADAPTTDPALAAAQRIAGASRFETAAMTALETFPDGADSVLIASGRTFADVAAAAGLAGVLGAPILLTEPSFVPDVTMEALARLRAPDVLILGGENAVSADVEFQLRQIYTGTRRIAGSSRFATAANIGLEMGPLRVGTIDGEPTAVIATGRNFPDALASGPVAYAGQFPVLLVEPDRLPQETAEAISDLGIQRVVIVGGDAAVGPEVEAALRSLVGTVTRLQGTGREATAAAVADFGVAEVGLLAEGTVLLADGGNFPDALAGGPHGGEVLAPILLSSLNDVPPATQAWVDANADDIQRVRALGGTAAVPDVVLGTLAPGVQPRQVDFIIPPDDAEGLIATALLPNSEDLGVDTVQIYEGLDGAAGTSIVAIGPDGETVATITDDPTRGALVLTAADGSVIQLARGADGGMALDWVNSEGEVGSASYTSEDLVALGQDPVISPFVADQPGSGRDARSTFAQGARSLKVPIHTAIALIRIDVDPPLRPDAVIPGISFDVECRSDPGTLCSTSGVIAGGLPIASVRMQHFVQAGRLQDVAAEEACLSEEEFTNKVRTVLSSITTTHGRFVTIGVLLAALANAGSIGALIGSIAAAAPVAAVVGIAGLLAGVLSARAELVKAHCARVGNEQAALDALGVPGMPRRWWTSRPCTRCLTSNHRC